MKWCILILMFAYQLSGQIMLDTSYFDSPVKHEIILAGSFGELRGTHFHAGIDIKPTSFNEIGDSLFVAAPGYISRIKVQTGGYGRVLYVDHPNGYTTVYAHMEQFADSIEAYIKQMQYQAQSYAVDIYPQANRFQLNRQQYIGSLGNTGRSYGAHLHFEIRKTDSETPINPALFGLKPEDDRAPDVVSISVHGLSSDMQEVDSKTYPIQKVSKHRYTINKGKVSIGAWRAGVLLQGWDRMNGASNKNGIYRIEMYADNELRYAATVDSMHWDESPYVKSHIDYAEKISNKRTAVRCYRMPGNQLTIYDDLAQEGVLKVFKDQARKITIKAIDIENNVSQIDFELSRSEVKEHNIEFEKMLDRSISYDFKMGSCRIQLDSNSLDRNLYMRYHQEQEEGANIYQLHADVAPLYRPISLTIPVEAWVDSNDLRKLIVVERKGNKITSYAGQIHQDSISFRTKNFGQYRLHIDTIAPEIKVVSLPKTIKNSTWLKFAINDELSPGYGASEVKIDAYLDGNWVLGRYKVLDKIFRLQLDSQTKGRHQLKIVAQDHVGNTKVWEDTIIVK